MTPRRQQLEQALIAHALLNTNFLMLRSVRPFVSPACAGVLRALWHRGSVDSVWALVPDLLDELSESDYWRAIDLLGAAERLTVEDLIQVGSCASILDALRTATVEQRQAA